MRIKDLASLSGTTVRTIRYYHQLGLLAVPDADTTWRAYGFAHLTRLMRIRWLVESGVPLAEVPHMLRPPGSPDERGMVIEDLGAVLASIDGKIAVLTTQRARVETLLDRVSTHGRLSPLPWPVVRVYAALLERPLSAGSPMVRWPDDHQDQQGEEQRQRAAQAADLLGVGVEGAPDHRGRRAAGRPRPRRGMDPRGIPRRSAGP